MFCSNCGTRNDENSRFCAECGNSLVTVEKTASMPTDAYSEPLNRQTSEPQISKPAEGPSFVKKIMTYELPEDAVIKLPFPSFVLKFIRMGIWTLLFLGMFFGWIFIRVKMSLFGYSVNEADSANLFKVVFNGGSFANGIGFLSFLGILVMLVILSVVAIQVLKIFIPEKLPAFFAKIPQLALCAAPAAITFLFMIFAWIILGSVLKEQGMDQLGAAVSAGPAFGAWFVFVLSGIETAAFFLFMKGKNESIFKA